MSTNGFTINDLVEFMEMLGRKGLLNKATAQARKIAATQVIAILDEEEKQDLRSLDVDAAFDRFANLSSSRFTPGSLRTYKTRFKKALEDFLEWRKNPMSFKPSLATKMSRPLKKREDTEVIPPSTSNTDVTRVPTSYKPAMLSIDVFPIRIREDIVVQVAHLPHDLTIVEADKIARVIKAHALETEEA